MALSKCGDCGYGISASARHCPNCGKPINPVTPMYVFVQILVGIAIVVVGVLLICGIVLIVKSN